MGSRLDSETQRLVEAFEEGTLPSLDHAAHVRLAWYYLGRAPLPRVLETFPRGLKRYAESKGAPHKYHETITFAFICLIHDRLARTPPCSWHAFQAIHHDLLDSSTVRQYYSTDVLDSDVARSRFLFPVPAFPD